MTEPLRAIPLTDQRRSFRCAGYVVTVSLCALRDQTGAPQFSVTWEPSRPKRLSGAEIDNFDRMRRQAVAELTTELRGISSC